MGCLAQSKIARRVRLYRRAEDPGAV